MSNAMKLHGSYVGPQEKLRDPLYMTSSCDQEDPSVLSPIDTAWPFAPMLRFMANDSRAKKTRINQADARRIAVAAGCDPRTVQSVLKGERRERSIDSRSRARAKLIEEGYEVPGGDDDV